MSKYAFYSKYWNGLVINLSNLNSYWLKTFFLSHCYTFIHLLSFMFFSIFPQSSCRSILQELSIKKRLRQRKNVSQIILYIKFYRKLWFEDFKKCLFRILPFGSCECDFEYIDIVTICCLLAQRIDTILVFVSCKHVTIIWTLDFPF